MFIELVDVLRCPTPHESTWLVAAFDRVEDRDVVEGMLGCPVCHAEFAIHDRAAWFTPRPADTGPVVDAMDDEAAQETAVRLGAFLDLTEPGGFVVLAGYPTPVAAALAEMVSTRVLLVNPPDHEWAPGVSVIHADPVAPLAPGQARGLAMRGALAATFVESLVRAVRSGARVVGEGGVSLPAGVQELARDANAWVGAQTDAPSVPITLKRRG